MHRIIPVAALAVGMAVSAAAQDSTVRSKTKVSGDDARAITLIGCLERGSGNVFTLKNAIAGTGEEVTTKSKVEKDVDNDGKDEIIVGVPEFGGTVGSVVILEAP